MFSRTVSFLAAMFLLITIADAGSGFSDIPAGMRTFTLNDKVGSNAIKFLSDAPMEKINGAADGVTGTFRMDPGQLEKTTGTFTVQVRSMKTAITKRDGHMYSEQWLDADKYPTITFEVKKLTDVRIETVNGRRVAKAKAIGDFTCHGVTKAHTADVIIHYVQESTETRSRASGDLVMIEATFEVALADHNIAGSASIVGSKVGKVIQIQASLFANS